MKNLMRGLLVASLLGVVGCADQGATDELGDEQLEGDEDFDSAEARRTPAWWFPWLRRDAGNPCDADGGVVDAGPVTPPPVKDAGPVTPPPPVKDAGPVTPPPVKDAGPVTPPPPVDAGPVTPPPVKDAGPVTPAPASTCNALEASVKANCIGCHSAPNSFNHNVDLSTIDKVLSQKSAVRTSVLGPTSQPMPYMQVWTQTQKTDFAKLLDGCTK